MKSFNKELLRIMKIWIKDPIQRPQLIERIQRLVDDLNKKKLKATKHILIANKEMEIMVRISHNVTKSKILCSKLKKGL